MCYEERERQLSTCGIDVLSEMRESERKEPGEIPNKDEGEIGWMKDMEKEGQNGKRKK
jgi:hypothetical protein